MNIFIISILTQYIQSIQCQTGYSSLTSFKNEAKLSKLQNNIDQCEKFEPQTLPTITECPDEAAGCIYLLQDQFIKLDCFIPDESEDDYTVYKDNECQYSSLEPKKLVCLEDLCNIQFYTDNMNQIYISIMVIVGIQFVLAMGILQKKEKSKIQKQKEFHEYLISGQMNEDEQLEEDGKFNKNMTKTEEINKINEKIIV